MKQPLYVLGECMVEVSAAPLVSSRVTAQLAYGGDTLNTAVYFARLGGNVRYLSALGDDALSDWMLEDWLAEGIDCSAVRRAPGGAPGLYLIQVNAEGERSFAYWREQSAARALLQDAERLRALLLEASNDSGLLYLSGITLALMSADSREALFEVADTFRRGGGLIAFDSNHRPRLWPDLATARSAYQSMYSRTDVALATREDEQAVFGDSDAGHTVRRLRGLGVSEIVVKQGEGGCLLSVGDVVTPVPARSVEVVDTTAAGDSFNAAYLFSRACDIDPLAAADCGHQLAGAVVGQRGAILHRDAMPALALPEAR